jgi:hypothetical protein
MPTPQPNHSRDSGSRFPHASVICTALITRRGTILLCPIRYVHTDPFLLVTRPRARPYSCFKMGVPSLVTSLVLTMTSHPVLAVRSMRKFTLAPVTISSGMRGDDRVLGMKFRVLKQSIATNGRKMAARSYPSSFLSSSCLIRIASRTVRIPRSASTSCSPGIRAR